MVLEITSALTRAVEISRRRGVSQDPEVVGLWLVGEGMLAISEIPHSRSVKFPSSWG